MLNNTPPVFNFLCEDNGYCRVYVKCEESLYCFQEELTGAPPVLYSCTSEGEPSYQVHLTDNAQLNLEGCEYLKDEIVEAFKRGDYFIKAKKRHA